MKVSGGVLPVASRWSHNFNIKIRVRPGRQPQLRADNFLFRGEWRASMAPHAEPMRAVRGFLQEEFVKLCNNQRVGGWGQ